MLFRIKLVKELSDLVPPFLEVKQLNDLLSTAPNSNSSLFPLNFDPIVLVNPRKHVPQLSESTCLRLMHTYASEFAQTARDYAVKLVQQKLFHQGNLEYLQTDPEKIPLI